MGKLKLKNKNSGPFKDAVRRCPRFKELQEKKYPLSDLDLSGVLDDLLEKGIIQLPELKRPEEVGRITDLKYCWYYRIVSHSLEKCVTLKKHIM